MQTAKSSYTVTTAWLNLYLLLMKIKMNMLKKFSCSQRNKKYCSDVLFDILQELQQRFEFFLQSRGSQTLKIDYDKIEISFPPYHQQGSNNSHTQNNSKKIQNILIMRINMSIKISFGASISIRNKIVKIYFFLAIDCHLAIQRN